MAVQHPKRPLSPVPFIICLASIAITLIVLASRGVTSPIPTPVLPTPTPSPTPRPKLERTSPEPVYQRTLRALRDNDAPALYNEIAPGLAATFDFDSFTAGMDQYQQQLGPIVEVRPISPPVIKSEPPWDGEWADAEVEIVRERGTARYLVRLHREDDEWWLFGTLELE